MISACHWRGGGGGGGRGKRGGGGRECISVAQLTSFRCTFLLKILLQAKRQGCRHVLALFPNSSNNKKTTFSRLRGEGLGGGGGGWKGEG